jgi:hypothetical protein
VRFFILPSFVFCVLITSEPNSQTTSASTGITYCSVRTSLPSYHSLDISILGFFLLFYIITFVLIGFSCPDSSIDFYGDIVGPCPVCELRFLPSLRSSILIADSASFTGIPSATEAEGSAKNISYPDTL